MVPNDAPSDWAVLGAQGAYDGYARQLAENLVSEGMGNSVIRLGWEANDTSNPENELPSDSSEYADWATYWDNIVSSMRAVPGANFQFDWTVNQYYRPLPLADWYPGDNFVDIIGIDAYDSGIYTSGLTPEQRWLDLLGEQDGLSAVAAFAAEHGKPLSIAEWGLADSSVGGAGDDPTYVEGLGSFIATHDVEYNSYFYSTAPGNNLLYLTDAPLSLAAYQQSFPGLANSATLTSTSTTLLAPAVASTTTSTDAPVSYTVPSSTASTSARATTTTQTTQPAPPTSRAPTSAAAPDPAPPALGSPPASPGQVAGAAPPRAKPRGPLLGASSWPPPASHPKHSPHGPSHHARANGKAVSGKRTRGKVKQGWRGNRKLSTKQPSLARHQCRQNRSTDKTANRPADIHGRQRSKNGNDRYCTTPSRPTGKPLARSHPPAHLRRAPEHKPALRGRRRPTQGRALFRRRGRRLS
jgi:hypothetical protein